MAIPSESARLWKTELGGIELFEAQLFRHRFGKHFHAAYTIGFNEGGQGCCQHRGEQHVHTSGSFNLINPGDIHTGQVSSSQGWRFRNIYIDLPLVEQLLAQLDWPGQGIPYFKQPILTVPDLKPLFYELFYALATAHSQLQQQSLLLELLSCLFQLNADNFFTGRPAKSESRAVRCIRTYLEAHYADNVSLEQLAQLVNISPYYLIRCFRAQVGCAPHQYQRHWQLVQVKRALQTGESLAAIAADHGFYDQSHLNRAFKKTYGVTPGQYQKGNQQDNSVQYDWL